jgi:DNA topoisomerase 2-associated protein PAT1
MYRNKQFAYFLSILLPHLPGLFPSSVAQKAAFGPGAYLLGNPVDRLNHDMERREAEVWGLAAA